LPCFFCIAAFVAVAGSITTAVLDKLADDLDEVAVDDVTRTVDTDKVATFALDVAAPPDAGRDGVATDTPVPVEVTTYKQAGRARISVRTHDVSAEQAEAIQDRVAAAVGLEVTERSGAQLQQRVQRAGSRRAAEAARSRGRRRLPRR
jgi:hypothetical protein